MAGNALGHLDAPKGVIKGLIVFYAGNNGEAPDGNNSGRYWNHWWEDALALGYAVMSVESPGPNWTDDEGQSPDHPEMTMALDIVKLVREHFLHDASLPTWHIGFSAGTGPASVNGYLDPNSRGFGMLCAAGRVQYARQFGGDRPIFAGYGGRDNIVDPVNTLDRLENQWRPLVGDALLVEKQGRLFHTPHPNYIPSCFAHLGIR